MTGPSRVLELNSFQTTNLRRAIEKRLAELDSLADETLVDYVLVLLANRHGREKVLNELEDFVSPMVVESFVNWLFQVIEDLKNGSNVDDTASTRQSISISGNPAKTDDKRPTKGTKEFQAALRGIQENVLVNKENDDAKMKQTRAQRFGSRHERSRSPQKDRNNQKRTTREERRARRKSRSRSPPETRGSKYKSPTRIVKYKSLHARKEEKNIRDSQSLPFITADEMPAIRDARELLASRRTVRLPTNGEDNGRDHAMIMNWSKPRERTNNDRIRQMSEEAPAQKVSHREEQHYLQEKKQRCPFWPNCKAGDACPRVHPSEPCKHFPNCIFGENCLFIHPAIPCKFQDKCQNPTCNYLHSSPAQLMSKRTSGGFNTSNNPYQPPSAITCRFYPNCKNVQCPFMHPSTDECKFGEACQRPACPFTHPPTRIVASKSIVNAPCRYGRNCAKPDCPFKHGASSINSAPAASIGVIQDVPMTDSSDPMLGCGSMRSILESIPTPMSQ